MKMDKTGHFCIQPNTPTPRRRSAHLGGGPYTYADPSLRFLNFLVRLGVTVLRLGEPLCLSVALLRLSVPASPVLVPLFR